MDQDRLMSASPEESDEKSAKANAQIVKLRDAGASWKEIQQTFGLSRQQARYAYQLGKRVERRNARRGRD
jgi:hypothetical protein